MKKIYYILTAFIACFVNMSCTTDNDPAIETITDINEISFNIHIPDAKIIHTRGEAIAEGMIQNIQVLVFDENGDFLSRAEAIAGNNPGNYKVRLAPTDPDLPQENKKRIIHFVANYDWNGFSDMKNIGKNQNEIIMNLCVGNNKITYWQWMELTNGIDENIFPNTILLVRNVARISVTDNPAKVPEAKYHLTDMSFAIGNYINQGTVAPFNSTSMTFDEDGVVESPEGVLQTIKEADFVPAGSNNNITESFLCYERKNSVSKQPLYVIVKGKYDTDTHFSYYKLDIFDELKEELYDIKRNYHYILEIRRVNGPGSATLQEAMDSPASNNLIYSVVLEKFTSISDGISILNVEMTERTLVHANKEYTFSYSYIPNVTTGIEDNTSVIATVSQDNSSLVIDENSIDVIRTTGKAMVKVKTTNESPTLDIRTGKLIISATTNGVKLRRAIQLYYRKPFEFENVTVPANIPTTIGSPVNINMTIPDNIKSTFYPLEVFITTKSLAPNVEPASDDKLTLDYTKPGIFRYKYIVHNPGNHIIHLKTSSSTADENLIIESELFNSVSKKLEN